MTTTTDGPQRFGTAVRGAAATCGALSSRQAREALQVRPDPVAVIRRPGAEPYRILLFSGGVLEGIGLADHELGLPGRIADEVAARRSRGVRLDVVVEPHPTSPAALAGLAGLRLRRYDAVVVVLGDDDAAQTDAAQLRGALVGLAKLLLTETCACAGLFVQASARSGVQGSPPAASRGGASAERLVAVGEEVFAMSRRVRFPDARPPPRRAGRLRGRHPR